MREILQYLADLNANNNREWYHANKIQYMEANAAFEQLVARLLEALVETNGNLQYRLPKELTFRLARDMRFSRDKTPFNPSFRAHLSAAGKSIIPVGCFLCLAPGDRSFLGGGMFASAYKDATAMIRDYIVLHGEELESIVNAKDFAASFTVRGEALKNVPRGYDAAHPQAEYLKFKSWYLQYQVSDKLLLSDSFVERAARIFRSMKPFNDYLNAALQGFKMPMR
ncbi:MAG: DUF2461 domain-containing protein [Oscillospiraceae bacterium]|jgi:uncharacterized protein (TIGR02453 family)|nr:DUF2461 domain-containing protein [Oscillospiraceae bacterium]